MPSTTVGSGRANGTAGVKFYRPMEIAISGISALTPSMGLGWNSSQTALSIKANGLIICPMVMGFSRISLESPIMGIGKMASSLGSALSALLMAANMSDSSGTMQKMEKGTSIGLTNRTLKGNLLMVRYFFCQERQN
jgi:hypothetical protein